MPGNWLTIGPVQGITRRAGEIVEQLLVQLRGWLAADLAAIPPALAASGLPGGDDCCKVSVAALATGGETFARAVVGALVAHCEAACKPLAADGDATRPEAKPELSLVELDAAEEDATLAAIARRLRSSASLPLLLLAQRFGVLLARPPVPAMELPLGPRAFCDALAAAAASLGLCPHARLALYRRFDLDGMALYPRFAEAVDESLDSAGILRGMSFVPLRRQAHIAIDIACATERDALQAVGRAAESLAPEASLPPGSRRGRRDAMAALARYLMRHGRDSNQWSECIEVAQSLQDAALAQGVPPMEAQAWLNKAFRDLGYGEDEASQLAGGLSSALDDRAAAERGTDQDAAGDAPVQERGVREQRCFERLRQLSPGAMLGFSAGRGGFLHAHVLAHHDEPPRLLLDCAESGCEIIFEADLLARMLASGEAWVMRRAAAPEAAP